MTPQFSRRTAALLSCLTGTLAPLTLAGGPPPCLHGRLAEHGGLRVLELWGTPEEAAYAHGYLLAPDAVALFDDYVLSERIIPQPEVYETILLPAVRRQFAWDPARQREFAALLRGVSDRLGPAACRSQKLDRTLRLEDLLAANTLADWYGVFCSTFSAWGDLTADGQTLTARNLDFPGTPAMQKAQLVIIYRGDGSQRPWAGVSWPSLLGAYTAMNADGVTVLMHDAPGLPPTHADGFTPRALILREALEAARPTSFVDDIRRVLTSHRVLVGNNIHVSAPAAPAETAGSAHPAASRPVASSDASRPDARRPANAAMPPAAVFEYDANDRGHGVTVRLPADHGLPTALACTNHMRARCTPHQCSRYDRLETALRTAAASGRKLAVADALELIDAVRVRGTLHTVVFVPHKRTMHVLIPAISREPVEFRLDDWLGREAAAPAHGGQP